MPSHLRTRQTSPQTHSQDLFNSTYVQDRRCRPQGLPQRLQRLCHLISRLNTFPRIHGQQACVGGRYGIYSQYMCGDLKQAFNLTCFNVMYSCVGSPLNVSTYNPAVCSGTMKLLLCFFFSFVIKHFHVSWKGNMDSHKLTDVLENTGGTNIWS